MGLLFASSQLYDYRATAVVCSAYNAEGSCKTSGLLPYMDYIGVTAGMLTSGLTPFFIRSMRTGPRDWRAQGHREIT